MRRSSAKTSLRLIASFGFAVVASTAALANPSLVIDVDSGAVLSQEQATSTWYPASLTKLMTAYVALKAVQEGRITLDTPLVVSARASRMAPSKMGFRPGTEVTLDNALKMLMVKSANDVAVTIAEGVSGSVEGFAEEMNRYARDIGMRDSHFVNPNGLPDSRQVTSARDMAVVGRTLLTQFPAHRGLFGIGALQLGRKIMPTHNGLMGRYPGVDGMKTGFTCAAGFNVVASASRGGRRLITVVLGAPSASDRSAKAASLFDRGFASGGGSGSISAMGGGGIGTAPDIRGEACVRRVRGGGWAGEFEDFAIPLTTFQSTIENNPQMEMLLERSGAFKPQPADSGRSVARRAKPYFEPIAVYIGRAPGWNGAVARARAVAPETKVIAAKAVPEQKAVTEQKPVPGFQPPSTPAVAGEAPALANAAAYAAPQKPQVLDAAQAVDAAAPMALSGAVFAKARPDAKAAKPKAKVAAKAAAKPKPLAPQPAAPKAAAAPATE